MHLMKSLYYAKYYHVTFIPFIQLKNFTAFTPSSLYQTELIKSVHSLLLSLRLLHTGVASHFIQCFFSS